MLTGWGSGREAGWTTRVARRPRWLGPRVEALETRRLLSGGATRTALAVGGVFDHAPVPTAMTMKE
jgi:hypothetical protein